MVSVKKTQLEEIKKIESITREDIEKIKIKLPNIFAIPHLFSAESILSKIAEKLFSSKHVESSVVIIEKIHEMLQLRNSKKDLFIELEVPPQDVLWLFNNIKKGIDALTDAERKIIKTIKNFNTNVFFYFPKKTYFYLSEKGADVLDEFVMKILEQNLVAENKSKNRDDRKYKNVFITEDLNENVIYSKIQAIKLEEFSKMQKSFNKEIFIFSIGILKKLRPDLISTLISDLIRVFSKTTDSFEQITKDINGKSFRKVKSYVSVAKKLGSLILNLHCAIHPQKDLFVYNLSEKNVLEYLKYLLEVKPIRFYGDYSISEPIGSDVERRRVWYIMNGEDPVDVEDIRVINYNSITKSKKEFDEKRKEYAEPNTKKKEKDKQKYPIEQMKKSSINPNFLEDIIYLDQFKHMKDKKHIEVKEVKNIDSDSSSINEIKDVKIDKKPVKIKRVKSTGKKSANDMLPDYIAIQMDKIRLLIGNFLIEDFFSNIFHIDKKDGSLYMLNEFFWRAHFSTSLPHFGNSFRQKGERFYDPDKKVFYRKKNVKGMKNYFRHSEVYTITKMEKPLLTYLKRSSLGYLCTLNVLTLFHIIDALSYFREEKKEIRMEFLRYLFPEETDLKYLSLSLTPEEISKIIDFACDLEDERTFTYEFFRQNKISSVKPGIDNIISQKFELVRLSKYLLLISCFFIWKPGLWSDARFRVYPLDSALTITKSQKFRNLFYYILYSSDAITVKDSLLANKKNVESSLNYIENKLKKNKE